jgi:hypothetical protein
LRRIANTTRPNTLRTVNPTSRNTAQTGRFAQSSIPHDGGHQFVDQTLIFEMNFARQDDIDISNGMAQL